MPRVRALAQKRIQSTHLRCKLESIVLRRILQLLVKARDRAAQLRAIRNLCVLRARKKQRIERHGRLFGAALARHTPAVSVADAATFVRSGATRCSSLHSHFQMTRQALKFPPNPTD